MIEMKSENKENMKAKQAEINYLELKLNLAHKEI